MKHIFLVFFLAVLAGCNNSIVKEPEQLKNYQNCKKIDARRALDHSSAKQQALNRMEDVFSPRSLKIQEEEIKVRQFEYEIEKAKLDGELVSLEDEGRILKMKTNLKASVEKYTADLKLTRETELRTLEKYLLGQMVQYARIEDFNALTYDNKFIYSRVEPTFTCHYTGDITNNFIIWLKNEEEKPRAEQLGLSNQ